MRKKISLLQLLKFETHFPTSLPSASEAWEDQDWRNNEAWVIFGMIFFLLQILSLVSRMKTFWAQQWFRTILLGKKIIGSMKLEAERTTQQKMRGDPEYDLPVKERRKKLWVLFWILMINYVKFQSWRTISFSILSSFCRFRYYALFSYPKISLFWFEIKNLIKNL